MAAIAKMATAAGVARVQLLMDSNQAQHTLGASTFTGSKINWVPSEVAALKAVLEQQGTNIDFDAASTALRVVGIERTAAACEGCAAKAACAPPAPQPQPICLANRFGRPMHHKRRWEGQKLLIQ